MCSLKSGISEIRADVVVRHSKQSLWSPQACLSINPVLVYCHVLSYRPDPPWSRRLNQAGSGVLSNQTSQNVDPPAPSIQILTFQKVGVYLFLLLSPLFFSDIFNATLPSLFLWLLSLNFHLVDIASF